jgi:uncharacterized protein (DUF697 family)
MAIVHRYVAVSAMAGLITLPVIDVAALGGVHVALIKELTDYYGAEFSEHTARNILIAIGASLIPGSIGSILGRKILRALPFITHGAGLLTMSGFAAAVSYALGLAFIRHFEAGGTLDSFDPENLHRIFARRVHNGPPYSRTPA